jgi:hypothetical protein
MEVRRAGLGRHGRSLREAQDTLGNSTGRFLLNTNTQTHIFTAQECPTSMHVDAPPCREGLGVDEICTQQQETRIPLIYIPYHPELVQYTF